MDKGYSFAGAGRVTVISRRIAAVCSVIVLIAGSWGCSRKTPEPAAARLEEPRPQKQAPSAGRASATPTNSSAQDKKPAAWINARSALAFPLTDTSLPRTGGQLADAMLTGWKGRLAFRDPSTVVSLIGGRYPAVDWLIVDFTRAVAAKEVKPTGASETKRVANSRSLLVKNFLLTADPLVQNKAKIHYELTAKDVRFDVRKDHEDRPILSLADASEGSFHFHATLADLERLMLAAAKEKAASKLIIVRSVQLGFHEIGPRSLRAEMYLATLVGFAPAGLRFEARVDIDDKLNAKLSEMKVDGDELLGPLIVSILRPRMTKYEGESRPLIAFPGGNLRLRDVQIRTGHTISLDAQFSK